MTDVRVTDAMAQTRSIQEYKHLDQEQREHAARMGTDATNKNIEIAHADIDESERMVGSREQAQEREQRQKKKKRRLEEDKPVPEREEGHLLDLKA